MKTNKNRRIIKGCLSGLVIMVLVASVTACSQKYSNPMQYMIDNSTTAKTTEKESSSEAKILDVVKGVLTFNTTTYVKAEKEYNDKQWIMMANDFKSIVSRDEVKEIAVIADKSILEEVLYFLIVTSGTDKPITILSEAVEKEQATQSTASIETSTTKNSYSTQATTTTKAKTTVESSTTVANGTADETASPSTKDYTFDLLDVKSIPRVEIIYDNLVSDGNILEKAINTYDGVVIISTSQDGELSYNAKAIVGDLEKQKNIVVVSQKDMQKTGLTPIKIRILLSLSIATKKEFSLK